MSKELEALIRLEHSSKRYKGRKADLDTIFTALKEKEQQDSLLKIFKEVIKFGKMLPRIKPNGDDVYNFVNAVTISIQRDIENAERELLRKWVLETCFPKELQALKIIKNKMVDINELINCFIRYDLKTYNSCCDSLFKEKPLTQCEYDLLKEVLKDE